MAKKAIARKATATAVRQATREVGDSVRLRLVVKPKSSKEALAEDSVGGLVLQINAPPVDGKANQRVVEVLAALAGLPKRRVSISSGETARHKEVAFAQADLDTLIASLACT